MALDLAAIKARAVAATEGPWKVIKGLGLGKVPMRDGVKSEALVEGSEWFPAMWLGDSSLNLNTADAEFIAHARQDIPALLAEIERLRLLVPSSQPETPTELERLRTLAEIAAAQAHYSRIGYYAANERDGHEHGFSTCTHPDCVLVRSALLVVQDEAPKADLLDECLPRVLELLRGSGITEPDELKHMLEEHARCRDEILHFWASRPSPADKE